MRQKESEDTVLPRIRDSVSFPLVLVCLAVNVWASPASSKLLALVPEEAQIVAGIEDPHNPASSGRLLLVTRNCNLEERNASLWMAILDDRTTVFGSTQLVRQALDRYLNRSVPDALLAERLRQVYPDVNSWNVLSAPMLARHVAPGQLHAAWTHILDGADDLTIGIHYGSTDRIDFAVHAVSGLAASPLARLATAPRVISVDLSRSMRLRLQTLSVEQDRVRGSLLVPGEQFDRWLASVYTRRSSAPDPHSQP